MIIMMNKQEKGKRRMGIGTFKTPRFLANEFTLHAFAEADSGFTGYILLEEMFLHTAHWLFEIFFCEDFAANDVAEQATDRT